MCTVCTCFSIAQFMTKCAVSDRHVSVCVYHIHVLKLVCERG